MKIMNNLDALATIFVICSCDATSRNEKELSLHDQVNGGSSEESEEPGNGSNEMVQTPAVVSEYDISIVDKVLPNELCAELNIRIVHLASRTSAGDAIIPMCLDLTEQKSPLQAPRKRRRCRASGL